MDEFNNLIDTGRFLREMTTIEKGQDEPEPHQLKGIVSGIDLNDPAVRAQLYKPGPIEFKRDQHLTPAALFKAKVLAVLEDEANQWSYAGNGKAALTIAIDKIMEIEP